jgi:hypothetical protein
MAERLVSNVSTSILKSRREIRILDTELSLVKRQQVVGGAPGFRVDLSVFGRFLARR